MLVVVVVYAAAAVVMVVVAMVGRGGFPGRNMPLSLEFLCGLLPSSSSFEMAELRGRRRKGRDVLGGRRTGKGKAWLAWWLRAVSVLVVGWRMGSGDGGIVLGVVGPGRRGWVGAFGWGWGSRWWPVGFCRG